MITDNIAVGAYHHHCFADMPWKVLSLYAQCAYYGKVII